MRLASRPTKTFRRYRPRFSSDAEQTLARRLSLDVAETATLRAGTTATEGWAGCSYYPARFRGENAGWRLRRPVAAIDELTPIINRHSLSSHSGWWWRLHRPARSRACGMNAHVTGRCSASERADIARAK